MNTWILGGVVAVAILIAIRSFFSNRRATPKSIFLQDRPSPDLSSAPDSAAAQQLREGLEHLAVEKKLPVSSIIRPAHPHEPVAAPPFVRAAQTVPSVFGFGTAAAGSRPGEPVVSRLSTWSDRRLFADFRGILGDSDSLLAKIEPEELPIRSSELVFGSLTSPLAQLLPESSERRDQQRRNLLAAGYHSRASWLNLTAIRFVLAFLSLAIVGFWLNTAPAQFEIPLLALVVIAPLVMWALPPLIVSMKSSERKIDIERGLPDLLDMLNMGVSQGLTVPQSLRRISQEITAVHPALADELRIVNHQADVGSLPQALKNFGQRIDSPDVNSFTTLLIQSEATGTSVSRALADYSDSIRSTLKERADSRANAASFKLLFPVALCLMPSVFLFLLGPAIVEMSDFFGTRAQALNAGREDAMDSLQEQSRQDRSRFQQNGF